MLEYLVFDFDGTVFDTEEEVVADTNAVLINRGYSPLSKEKIERLRALHAKDVITEHLNIKWYSLYKWLELPGMLTEGRRLFAKRQDSVLPYKGMKDLINELSKTKKIIIVSSNAKETIEYAFQKNQIKYDEVHHCVKLFGKGLELDRIIKEKKLKNDRDKIIYVGDEVRDVYACYYARIGMAAVTWGLNNEEAFKNIGFPKDYIIKTPEHLKKRLLEL